jgi:ABC-2 type transport system permease protein
MKPATADATFEVTRGDLGRAFDPRALWALFVLTIRRAVHGRRLLVLSLLFLLPSLLAVVLRLTTNATPSDLEFALVFLLIPYAMATLTALLYAGGMIQDEVEEQTLTYLLLRPLPRWALYVTKFAATWLVTATLTCSFTILTMVMLWWNTAEMWDGVPARIGKTSALMALAQLAYCAGFGLLSMFTRRSLIAGLCYIVAFEGFLASFDWVVRQLTVMYYFRVLAARWLDLEGSRSWSLHLDTAPTATRCLLTLVIATVAFVALGAMMMMRQEFRTKTPEGS